MKRKRRTPNGRNARHWWNVNVPRRDTWPNGERESRKANQAMFRSIGTAVILSILGAAGSSWLTVQSKITELELEVAVLKTHVLLLRQERLR